MFLSLWHLYIVSRCLASVRAQNPYGKPIFDVNGHVIGAPPPNMTVPSAARQDVTATIQPVCTTDTGRCGIGWTPIRNREQLERELQAESCLFDGTCGDNATAVEDSFFGSQGTMEFLSSQEGPCGWGNPDFESPKCLPGMMDVLDPVLTWMRGGECRSKYRSYDAFETKVTSLGCCEYCDFKSGNVDLFYWPDPNADTSCLSIVAPGEVSIDYGATTDPSVGVPQWGSVYWGCTSFIGKTKVINTIASLDSSITSLPGITSKIYLLNPWDTGTIERQCGTDWTKSLPFGPPSLNAPAKTSTGVRATSLVLPSGSGRFANGSRVSTVVSGSYTFTSPSIYAHFTNIRVSDACGATSIANTLFSFAPGELSSVETHDYLDSTSVFNPADLPCPPIDVQKRISWKPSPGDPYNPMIAFPPALRNIDKNWFTQCGVGRFRAHDPPHILEAQPTMAADPSNQEGIRPAPAQAANPPQAQPTEAKQAVDQMMPNPPPANEKAPADSDPKSAPTPVQAASQPSKVVNANPQPDAPVNNAGNTAQKDPASNNAGTPAQKDPAGKDPKPAGAQGGNDSGGSNPAKDPSNQVSKDPPVDNQNSNSNGGIVKQVFPQNKQGQGQGSSSGGSAPANNNQSPPSNGGSNGGGGNGGNVGNTGDGNDGGGGGGGKGGGGNNGGGNTGGGNGGGESGNGRGGNSGGGNKAFDPSVNAQGNNGGGRNGGGNNNNAGGGVNGGQSPQSGGGGGGGNTGKEDPGRTGSGQGGGYGSSPQSGSQDQSDEKSGNGGNRPSNNVGGGSANGQSGSGQGQGGSGQQASGQSGVDSGRGGSGSSSPGSSSSGSSSSGSSSSNNGVVGKIFGNKQGSGDSNAAQYSGPGYSGGDASTQDTSTGSGTGSGGSQGSKSSGGTSAGQGSSNNAQGSGSGSGQGRQGGTGFGFGGSSGSSNAGSGAQSSGGKQSNGSHSLGSLIAGAFGHSDDISDDSNAAPNTDSGSASGGGNPQGGNSSQRPNGPSSNETSDAGSGSNTLSTSPSSGASILGETTSASTASASASSTTGGGSNTAQGTGSARPSSGNGSQASVSARPSTGFVSILLSCTFTAILFM